MGAIAALVMATFVVVALIGTMVAEVQQHRNINRPAMSGTEGDRHSTDRLAA
jgi:hypothetical protein